SGGPRFTPVASQTVTNRFGTVVVDVIKPVRLLVPSSMSPTSPPPPLTAPLADAFTCYRIKRHPHMLPFPPVPGVQVVVDFVSRPVHSKRPTRLCALTAAYAQGPVAAAHRQHLLCYRTAPPRSSARFVAHRSVFVNGDLGPLTLDALRPQELCVPSIVHP